MTDPWVKPSADLVEPLVAEVARLGGLAEAQIADCIDAISRRDVPLAHAVIATQQPVGRTLRRTVAALKIAMNLERIGDLARNIAKRSLVLSESDPLTPLTRPIERMGRLVGGR